MDVISHRPDWNDFFIEKVRDFAGQQALFKEGDHLLLSVSAGKDSVALLHVILALAGEMNLKLRLFHLNHQVRGEEAEADERFIRDEAARYGLEIVIRRFDFTTLPPARSFEEYAREVRYTMLREIQRENELIVTAHTGSDQEETLIMRLFQGTSQHGLKGIAPERDGLIRPLLTVYSDEVYDFLTRRGLEWREDESNSDRQYLRNRVRHEVIPFLRNHFPSFSAALANLSTHAVETEQMIETFLYQNDTLLLKKGDKTCIYLESIKDNKPLFMYLLAKTVREDFSEYVSRRMLEEAWRRLAESAYILYERPGLRVAREYDGETGSYCISVKRETAKPECPEEWEYGISLDTLPLDLPIPDGTVLRIEYAGINPAEKAILVTIPDETDQVSIRNRRKGDRVRLFAGTKKLKKLFNEKKLDIHVRDCVPLLIVNSVIAAVIGVGDSHYPGETARDFVVSHRHEKALAIWRRTSTLT